jgi:hypothetical protein
MRAFVWGVMAEDLRSYRVYAVTPDGHFAAAPVVIDCPGDAQAISRAKAMQDGLALEIWDGARMVAKLDARAEDGTPPREPSARP